MKTVKIAGVPEHFNLPWHLAMEEAAFNQRGIDLQWQNVPEGTGKMCQMLGEGETDLAIILTEGITKSIIDGNPSNIVQEYIASPLHWGVHVSSNSAYYQLNDLRDKKAAISRYGSGSHLMAFVLAQQKGWNQDSLQFEVVQHLDGAISALEAGNADYFLWEHFTTKPLVDSRVFRWLGDCPTPWPCFVIAASRDFIRNHGSVLNHILEIINLYTTEFKRIPSIDRTLANRYGQQLEDIVEWLGKTQWSQSQLSTHTLDNVIDTLFNLKLINKKMNAEEIITNV
ncbi:MAG: substrate-binding domain-containing protein [Flavobacteriaceae bacterium]